MMAPAITALATLESAAAAPRIREAIVGTPARIPLRAPLLIEVVGPFRAWSAAFVL